jgi:hypothetical protein
MLRRLALVRTDISEECIASIIKVKRIEARYVFQLLITARALHSSLIIFTLIMKAIRSSKTSIITCAVRRNIPEDPILHSHRRENLKYEMARLISLQNLAVSTFL